MRIIHTAIFTLALALTAVACVDDPGVSPSAQAISAGSVTVPIPVTSVHNGTGVTFQYASSQDAYGNNLLVTPIYSVPIGATITGIRARVQGNLAQQCWFVAYQQADIGAVTAFTSSNESALTLSTQTIEAPANFVVPVLKPLFVNFGPNFNGPSSCIVIALEVTYTPPL